MKWHEMSFCYHPTSCGLSYHKSLALFLARTKISRYTRKCLSVITESIVGINIICISYFCVYSNICHMCVCLRNGQEDYLRDCQKLFGLSSQQEEHTLLTSTCMTCVCTCGIVNRSKAYTHYSYFQILH